MLPTKLISHPESCTANHDAQDPALMTQHYVEGDDKPNKLCAWFSERTACASLNNTARQQARPRPPSWYDKKSRTCGTLNFRGTTGSLVSWLLAPGTLA